MGEIDVSLYSPHFTGQCLCRPQTGKDSEASGVMISFPLAFYRYYSCHLE